MNQFDKLKADEIVKLATKAEQEEKAIASAEEQLKADRLAQFKERLDPLLPDVVKQELNLQYRSYDKPYDPYAILTYAQVKIEITATAAGNWDMRFPIVPLVVSSSDETLVSDLLAKVCVAIDKAIRETLVTLPVTVSVMAVSKVHAEVQARRVVEAAGFLLDQQKI